MRTARAHGTNSIGEIEAAIESLKALRKRTGKITVKELLSARNEGRKPCHAPCCNRSLPHAPGGDLNGFS